MHVKAMVKTVFNWLQPEWYQTNDNNVDLMNQFENTVLTEEFMSYQKAMKATLELLGEYEFYKAIKDEGLLITEKEKKKRARATYDLWLDCNFIQKGAIVPGVLEVVADLINQ